MARRLPIGAELVDGEGMHVRVWAPGHPRVTLVIEGSREVELERDAAGYHAGLADAGAGTRYRFRAGDQVLADPASRFQPEGPFGPSELIDPRFPWTDAGWRGIAPERHVIYEMHVGTFTPAGTFAAAIEQLPFLAELGITTLELMPLAEFPGGHNWGYDGVNLFAPAQSYGRPDDVRRFVDRAHALGLAVIHDVVYNHLGPAGSPLVAWSASYRSATPSEWGDAIDFTTAGVREYITANAAYWISEFHLDGLRIDATQAIIDHSPRHILADIARAARDAGEGRTIFLVGENEPQHVDLLGGDVGLDALWNDDFHHAARVALTGSIEGYLHDYRGTPQELISAVKRGFLYQGQLYAWQKAPRGTPTRGLAPTRFVHFLENHDQVANLGFGERLPALAHPGDLRALTALLLLGPELPMLFQGQETGARTPWQFFADHCDDLGTAVREGRAKFVAQFAPLATAESQAALSDPCTVETFRRCILDPVERSFANPTARLHRDLLRLRRELRGTELDGAVLAPRAFALRWFDADHLLLVNLGESVQQPSVPEPLVAPPAGSRWRLAWSSEHPDYGGHGTPPVFDAERLALPAHAAVLLIAEAT